MKECIRQLRKGFGIGKTFKSFHVFCVEADSSPPLHLFIWSKYSCRGILKLCQLVTENQFHASHGAIAMLCDNDLSNILFYSIFLILIRAINKHHDIRVLLEGPRFSQ